MVLVTDRGPHSMLGAEVAHEDRDDQSVRFVGRHLDEPARAQTAALVVAEMSEILHLEEPVRLGAPDPWCAAMPRADIAKGGELLVDPLETLSGQAVKAVMKNPRHVRSKPTRRGRGSGRRPG